jgi:hypothetical protein
VVVLVGGGARVWWCSCVVVLACGGDHIMYYKCHDNTTVGEKVLVSVFNYRGALLQGVKRNRIEQCILYLFTVCDLMHLVIYYF